MVRGAVNAWCQQASACAYHHVRHSAEWRQCVGIGGAICLCLINAGWLASRLYAHVFAFIPVCPVCLYAHVYTCVIISLGFFPSQPGCRLLPADGMGISGPRHPGLSSGGAGCSLLQNGGVTSFLPQPRGGFCSQLSDRPPRPHHAACPHTLQL